MSKYKIIIFISLFLLVKISIAQITITSSEMPSANDTIRYSIVQTAPGVDFKTTGANKTWDYTALKASSQDIYEFKNSSSTPYIFNFGLGAIGVKMADSLGTGQIGLKDIYNFFKKSSSKWEAIGIGFKLSALPLPQAGKYTNNDEIYQFPLNYNDKDSSTFVLNIPLTAYTISIGNFYRWGNRVNYCEGWGKISTPYKSDIECLKVKSIITEMDSFAIAITGQQPINFAFPNNRIEYKWLAKNEKIPILEVSGNNIGGNFTATDIKFRDKYITITNPFAPVADFTADDLMPETGQTVNFTDNSSNNPMSFLWEITPSSFSYDAGTTNSSKNPKIKFTAAGKYTVKLTSTNIAGKNSITKTDYLNVSNNAGIKSIKKITVKTYPNPAKEIVKFEIDGENNKNLKIFIFDVNAKNVYSGEIYNSKNIIDFNVKDLESGHYTAVILSNAAMYISIFEVLR